uniref:Uncharacterized protein n=1 Tax=Chromera velia CCMP2878 TaxID=1169474 RepID=A0A0G4I542_9ALVE|eukprot:Cvel_11047.t1-p1 / transcript=Cvel_11047.t1 / gene=Cvel_11047 / organism=Chromera_velia_CCMP2878 / gene_product=hypothetical protein / transcript_product=hypothetical protein / location=Cvel_scaffold681:31125-32826(+) / protein_length=405 / sequence_SO=supercontig / SO=protein_coding / is_pseudo=false
MSTKPSPVSKPSQSPEGKRKTAFNLSELGKSFVENGPATSDAVKPRIKKSLTQAVGAVDDDSRTPKGSSPPRSPSKGHIGLGSAGSARDSPLSVSSGLNVVANLEEERAVALNQEFQNRWISYYKKWQKYQQLELRFLELKMKETVQRQRRQLHRALQGGGGEERDSTSRQNYEERIKEMHRRQREELEVFLRSLDRKSFSLPAPPPFPPPLRSVCPPPLPPPVREEAQKCTIHMDNFEHFISDMEKMKVFRYKGTQMSEYIRLQGEVSAALHSLKRLVGAENSTGGRRRIASLLIRSLVNRFKDLMARSQRHWDSPTCRLYSSMIRQETGSHGATHTGEGVGRKEETDTGGNSRDGPQAPPPPTPPATARKFHFLDLFHRWPRQPEVSLPNPQPHFLDLFHKWR